MSLSLKWNIILSALKAGRTAKLNHMDILEADQEKIVAGNRETGQVYMTFLAKDIGRQGVPQIEHFEGRYFNDKGVELRRLRNYTPARKVPSAIEYR